MRILIVSQYFWPETFRINDLVQELIIRGYEVDVLTAKPNYPQGKFYKGYSFFSNHNEVYFGAKIFRVPIIPRGTGSGVRLALNYLSFVFFGCLFVLFKSAKYDATITFAISPITQIFPALLHKYIKKSKAFLWLQDLWPESVSSASDIKNKFVLSALGKMVKYIYKKVDKIFIQSEYFKDNLSKYNSDPTKVFYLPNWSEDVFTTAPSDELKYHSLFPKGFVVLFAGNIGESQDFESIINTAKILSQKKTNIKFVIVGDGRKRAWVEHEIVKNNLQNIVFLLGRHPVEEMPNFFTHADVMLLTLKDEPIFSLTIPSKIQSYMAFGKPIIGMLNGIGSDLIVESKCGSVCPAGDYEMLATNLYEIASLSETDLIELGNNARKYYWNNFAKETVVDNLEAYFKSMI